jgi:hypothetical protein
MRFLRQAFCLRSKRCSGPSKPSEQKFALDQWQSVSMHGYQNIVTAVQQAAEKLAGSSG